MSRAPGSLIHQVARVLLTFVLALLGLSARAVAQREPSIVNLTHVPPGVSVRMWTADGSEVSGHFRAGRTDSVRLVVRCPGSDCPTPYVNREYLTGDIRSLEYYAGNSADRGFLIGALIGVTMAGVSTLAARDSEDLTKAQAFGITALAFGGTGALLGLAIGATYKIWIGVDLRSP